MKNYATILNTIRFAIATFLSLFIITMGYCRQNSIPKNKMIVFEYNQKTTRYANNTVMDVRNIIGKCYFDGIHVANETSTNINGADFKFIQYSINDEGFNTQGNFNTLKEPSRFSYQKKDSMPPSPFNQFRFLTTTSIKDLITSGVLKNVGKKDDLDILKGRFKDYNWTIFYSKKDDISHETIREKISEKNIYKSSVNSFGIIENIMYPKLYHYAVYNDRGLMFVHDYEVTKTSIQNNTLNIKFQPGSEFQDQERNIHWKLGPNGEKIFQDFGEGRNRNMTIGIIFICSISTLLIITLFKIIKRKNNAS